MLSSSFSSVASFTSSLVAAPKPKRESGTTTPCCFGCCFLGLATASSPLKKGNLIASAAVGAPRALATTR